MAGRVEEIGSVSDAIFLTDKAPIFSTLTGRRFYSFRHLVEQRVLDLYDPDYVVLDRSKPSRRFARVLELDRVRRWKLSDLGHGEIEVFEAVRPQETPHGE